MRTHAGQPAFPGGAADPGETDPVDTALREATEEVGLDPTTVEVQGLLPPLWIPVSGFVVTPVLAWWRKPHPVAPVDLAEVESVQRVRVADLVDPAQPGSRAAPERVGRPGLPRRRHVDLGLHGRHPDRAPRHGRLGRAVGLDRAARATSGVIPSPGGPERDSPSVLGFAPYPERVPGSLVDVVLIFLIAIFAINGYRQGFVVGLLSFVGFFGGAALGLQLGPLIAGMFVAEMPRLIVSLVTVFGLALMGQALANWVGVRLRGGIHNRTGQTLDDVGGALVSVVALLIVAWLVAAPLGSSSLPGLARAIRTSTVLHGVNTVMPQQAQALSNELRSTVDTSGFPNVFGALIPTERTLGAGSEPGARHVRDRESRRIGRW